MKKKIIAGLIVLFMIGLLGFYIWDIVYNKTPLTENLFRVLAIEFLMLGTLFRMFGAVGRQDITFYEKQYKDDIGNAFECSIQRKKLLCALRLYNEDNLRKALKYLFDLKKECKTPDDFKAVYLFTAICLSDMGAVYPAIEEYRELLKIDPENYTGYSNLGLLYEACGDFKNANLCFLKSIELKPDNHFAYNNIAHCYFKQHDYDSAIEYATKTLEYNNSFRQSLSLLSVIYYLKNDRENCDKYFQMAVAAGENANDLKESFEIFKVEYNDEISAEDTEE